MQASGHYTIIISLHKFFVWPVNIWQTTGRLYRRKDVLNISLSPPQFHTAGNQRWDISCNRKQYWWHQMLQTKSACNFIAKKMPEGETGSYRSLWLWQLWSPACCRNWITFLRDRTRRSWTSHLSVQKRLHPMTSTEYLWLWVSGYSSIFSVVSKIYFHTWKT